MLALTTVYASKAQAMRAAQAKWDKLQREALRSFQLRWRLVGLIYSLRYQVRVSGFKRVIDERYLVNQ